MSERRLIARHAGTVLVGQMATMAFGVTDTVVAGRFDQDALAALSIGAAIFISVFVALTGTLQSLLPVWAELHGAGRREAMGRSVRQALYLCAAATAVGAALLLSPGPLLAWTEVPPAMRGAVGQYLAVLAAALPATLLFRIYATLNQAIGRPSFVTWLQVGALAVKVPLSIWLTFGGLGMPALGLMGCALATLTVHWLMLAVAVLMLRHRPEYQAYRLWRRPERPDWPQLATFARLGVPAGLSVMVEVSSFTFMALFIARLGSTATAAHQIASNLTAVAYMVPLSLGLATSARVGYWMGAGRPDQARRACWQGLGMALLAALGVAGLVLALRGTIVQFYTREAAVAHLAAGLLAACAAYHLADATQTLCIFVLRCFRITVAPLIVYCALLWGVGLGGGYRLAYHGLGPWPAQHSPLAFWIMAAAALGAAALILLALLRLAVSRAGHR